MIRQLILSKEETNKYKLTEKDTERILTIEKKVINGEELYRLFFDDYDGDTFEINYNDNDKIIGKQIQALFDKIEKMIAGIGTK